MQFNSTPRNEQELLQRCEAIAGKTLGALAEIACNEAKISQTPRDNSLIHAKGFAGQLIEWHLGAPGGNLPMPDFAQLGIELKTLPINAKGLPQESTYVCTAPYTHETKHLQWRDSRVYQKLKRVLWVPIEADASIPFQDRQVGNAILWSPDSETEQLLREDWEELMEMLLLGRIERLTAHFGTYLQLRPKAAHSRVLQTTVNEQGDEVLAGPKGFYLRSRLTKKILADHYL